MKKYIIITILISCVYCTNAQKLDLIVTTDKDSLACHIDSITDKSLFLKMMYNNNWINTLMDKNNIFEYKENVIDISLFKFKEGTSYIYTNTSNYDLIVTTERDSIACHIDSITDSFIYIEMLNKGKWIHTMFKKEQILEYKKFAVNKKLYKFKNGSSYIFRKQKPQGYQHAHKLMFAPTSYSLKNGEVYVYTNFGLVYSLQIGLSDNVSVDFGTSLLLFPAYGMINVSFPVSENLKLTFGDIAVSGTWLDDPLIGNLMYGIASFGKPEKNLNLGAGYLYISNSHSPALTVSYQRKLNQNTYFLTENYLTAIRAKYESGMYENTLGYEYEYRYHTLFFGGLTGFRFTGIKNPRFCFQLGLAHLFLFDDKKVPAEFLDHKNHLKESRGLLDDGRFGFTPFPLIGLAYKFSGK